MDPSVTKCSFNSEFNTIKLHTYPSMNQNHYLVEKLPSSTNNSYQNFPIGNENTRDPFENVPFQPFISRKSITLANLDAVFNFSDHTGGYIIQQEMKDFTFVTLHDDGSFAQYLLYRNPSAYGYGFQSLSTGTDSWHFNQVPADDYKDFIHFMKSVEVTGNNLIVSEKNFRESLIIALSVIKIGSVFVSKMNDLDRELLWITAQCFDRITLIKPLSAINDTYLVAEGAKVNNSDWLSYLLSSNDQKFKTLPSDFIQWIDNFILFKYPPLNIDTYKCKAIWNLP